ncbi:recyclin-1, partial [Lecanoromycetidae sp. Uapishka_2]
MSAFKRVQVTGGAPRRSVLAPLRDTQIINSKPVLPAEILSTILDYLPIPELLRFARVSKRMKEMVYDDTRWVQRLQLMGCWNENEARKRAEAARRKRSETLQSLQQEEMKRIGIGVNEIAHGINGINGAEQQGRSSVTLFNAADETGKPKATSGGAPKSAVLELDDGFDAIDLTHEERPISYQAQDNTSRLKIFAQVRSLRGFARQEYGKVYGVLAPFYFDAVRCENHTHAIVFRTYRDPDQQAQMLCNIAKFSDSDMYQGWLQRKEKFAAVAGAFEAAVTREFEQALDAQDVAGKMKKYAHVLVSLNGGQSGVDLFISRSWIISSRYRLGAPLNCLTSGNFSAEVSYSFFSNVSTAFNEQVSIIDQVFPSSVNVIVPLVQRVGKVVITEYLTALFDEAHRVSIESYLKAISITCDQCLELAKSLRPTNSSGDEFYEAVDEVIATIFELHVDLYLKEELEFFKKKSASQVSDWEKQLSEQDASMQSMFMSNVNRQADKRDFLTSFKKVVMMPVNVLPAFPISSPFGGKPAVAKALVNGETVLTADTASSSQTPTRASSPGVVNGTVLSANRPITPLPEPPTTELAAKAAIMNSRLEGIRSLFSIEVALNLVHLAKSSIERAAVFVKLSGHFAKDARLQCELIFISLLQTLGTRHIKAGFDQAVDHLSNYKPKENSNNEHAGLTPLVTFLELVNVGDLIQQMVDVFYGQEMVATKLSDRDDFLNPAVKEKKRFEQMLDERVAAGLNKGIEVLMAEVEYVCATHQKAEDYNPGASSGANSDVMDIGPSEAATQIVEIVSSHTKMLVGSTDKNMLDVFNQEVGMRLFTALCKHLKRQRISVNGSIKLISDMNLYFSYIQTLKNQDLLQFFKALRELSQIYLVDPSDAKELATIIADGDRFYGIFRAEEVYQFAERRADWYQIKSKVERAMYGIGCLVM